jgi:phenylpropionate dioxygenase-like ring-hydroxylating dioxygenase large terminal subunit
MTQPPPVTLVNTLLRRLAGTAPGPQPGCRRIPVSHYSDPQRFDRERERIFLHHPLLLGHASQLPDAGDAIIHDWLGLPLITLRDREGAIGTYLNVCRHRGMRLVEDQGQTSLRSLVCPYHQWTYGLDGRLRNIPRSESFTGLEMAELGLVAVPTEVRHGLIWLQADRTRPLDLDPHLAGLGADLDFFDLADYHFCEQSVRTVNANWKLIQDAFLDGYHVTRLHKNTVGSFFPDALAESDLIGRHVRNAVARNEIGEAADLSQEQRARQLRQHATFSYTVFPNAVIVFQPDYPSILSLFPLAVDRTVFVHSMLTPHPPANDQERDHFRRSFQLIDEGVFAAEDAWVAAGAQQGMLSGANEHLLFGALEEAATHFHDIIEGALD